VKPRVLIAGCGYLGRATADLFHFAQWEVEAWTHSPESAAQLSARPYPVHAVDIADSAAVEEAAAEFDAVIHCASSGGGGAAAYRQVYFEGAKNLLAALRPRLFIYTSSTSVYAQTAGEWVDETSAAEPKHETGKILRETEEFVRQSGGWVARLAGIYGPGRSALLRKFLSGEARIEEGGGRYLNQVHRDDIASALFLLASLPNEHGIVNVSDDQPLTQRECYAWLAAKLDRPLPAGATQVGKRKRGVSNKRISNRKLRALGWEPQYPTFIIGMEKSVLSALPTEGARSGTPRSR
jgi:nucleoside-diphosphate-sugar epimerase